MNQIACSFAPGFEKIIKELIKSRVNDAQKFNVSSGFVYFFSSQNPIEISSSLDFCNNVFLILKDFSSSVQKDFASLVNKTVTSKFNSSILELGAKDSFRLRFSQSNQFVNVEKQLTIRAENFIQKTFSLQNDRTGGGKEFWFMTRTDGFAAFAYRMTQKQSTEKRFEQGELRSEFALMFVKMAQLPHKGKFVYADPFAGHGSISKILSEECSGCTIYASDIDNDLVGKMAQKFNGNRMIRVRQSDATNLSFFKDNSVDCVISDPPWGDFEKEIDIPLLYKKMLVEFDRILKDEGKLCILTGAKNHFEQAVKENKTFSKNSQNPDFKTDVLVNGKKASIYLLKK